MAREIEGRHHLALWFGWLVGWLASKSALLWAPWLGNVQGQPLNLTLYCVGSAGTRVSETAFSDWTLQPASLSWDVHHPERPSAVEALSVLRPYAAQLQLCIMVCCLWWLASKECSTSQQQLECRSSGGNHTAHYQGCVKLKEAMAVLSKWMPVEGGKGAAHLAFPPRRKQTEQGHPPNRRA